MTATEKLVNTSRTAADSYQNLCIAHTNAGQDVMGKHPTAIQYSATYLSSKQEGLHARLTRCRNPYRVVTVPPDQVDGQQDQQQHKYAADEAHAHPYQLVPVQARPGSRPGCAAVCQGQQKHTCEEDA